MATIFRNSILVIDDDKAVANNFTYCLPDFFVKCVYSQTEAYDVFTSHQFDLIFIDLYEQKKGQFVGLKLIESLRKKALQTPIVGITNYNLEDLEQKVIGKGANLFILKNNLNATEINKTIEKFIKT